MKNFLTIVLAALAIAPSLIILVSINVIFGAIGGWIVGLFFDEMILDVLARFSVSTDGLTMWRLGGTLAFIGSFFKFTHSRAGS